MYYQLMLKLSSQFQIKDQIKKDHQYGLIIHAKCLEKQCTEDYKGETGRRLIKHVKVYCGKDAKLH